MKKLLSTTVAALIVVLATAPAHAYYYSYFQWSRLDDGARAIYAAGAFDTMISFQMAMNETGAAQHYSNCTINLKVDSRQLSEGLMAYGMTAPELDKSSSLWVMHAIGYYLAAMCGMPPK